jgi:hypothetical protein
MSEDKKSVHDIVKKAAAMESGEQKLTPLTRAGGVPKAPPQSAANTAAMQKALAGAKRHRAAIDEEKQRIRNANKGEDGLRCLRCTCPRAMPGVFVTNDARPTNDKLLPSQWYATYRARKDPWPGGGPPICQVCYEETGVQVELRVRMRLIDAVNDDENLLERANDVLTEGGGEDQ